MVGTVSFPPNLHKPTNLQGYILGFNFFSGAEFLSDLSMYDDSKCLNMMPEWIPWKDKSNIIFQASKSFQQLYTHIIYYKYVCFFSDLQVWQEPPIFCGKAPRWTTQKNDDFFRDFPFFATGTHGARYVCLRWHQAPQLWCHVSVVYDVESKNVRKIPQKIGSEAMFTIKGRRSKLVNYAQGPPL